MDTLLKGDYISFAIDEIMMHKSAHMLAHIIPDTKSKFFPPFHLRYIGIPPSFLEERYYTYKFPYDREFNTELFRGVIRQGGYYRISTKGLKLNGELITDDIFSSGFQSESPYEKDIRKPNLTVDEISSTPNLNSDRGYVKIYCFDVGQGDSFLLITSLGTVFLIDMNVYNASQLQAFIRKIKSILKSNLLNPRDIKGLIISHKHIDHLRGASELILSNEFNIEYFVLNFDYVHKTAATDRLLRSANSIKNWVNINRPAIHIEGNTRLCFKNPTEHTSTIAGAPDINDSSICICIGYKTQSICLTGDTGHRILNSNFQCAIRDLGMRTALLKVSHHGSNTGTNEPYLDFLKPKHAFISAGNSRRYNHPSQTVIDLLRAKSIDTSVSKDLQRNVLYEINAVEVIKSFF